MQSSGHCSSTTAGSYGVLVFVSMLFSLNWVIAYLQACHFLPHPLLVPGRHLLFHLGFRALYIIVIASNVGLTWPALLDRTISGTTLGMDVGNGLFGYLWTWCTPRGVIRWVWTLLLAYFIVGCFGLVGTVVGFFWIALLSFFFPLAVGYFCFIGYRKLSWGLLVP
jgi:hypothetical protein